MEVVGFKPPAPGAKNFRLDNGPDKLLKGHAVVGEKAGHAGRGRAEDAQPACGFFAEDRAKAQVDTHGNQYGEGRAQELPDGKAEEYRFLVAAYFFRDFYFYNLPLLFVSQVGTHFYSPNISLASRSAPFTSPTSTSILKTSCPRYSHAMVTAGSVLSTAGVELDKNAE